MRMPCSTWIDGGDRYGQSVAQYLWVAKLYVSERTAQKLAERHKLDYRDVIDAVVCVRGLAYTWEDHPERGRRAKVEATIGGRECLIVLYPVDDPQGDVYALGSAYPR